MEKTKQDSNSLSDITNISLIGSTTITSITINTYWINCSHFSFGIAGTGPTSVPAARTDARHGVTTQRNSTCPRHRGTVPVAVAEPPHLIRTHRPHVQRHSHPNHPRTHRHPHPEPTHMDKLDVTARGLRVGLRQRHDPGRRRAPPPHHPQHHHRRHSVGC
jgi:hypothetical protein